MGGVVASEGGFVAPRYPLRRLRVSPPDALEPIETVYCREHSLGARLNAGKLICTDEPLVCRCA